MTKAIKVKKPPVEKKETVKLISYTIRAVIRTGEYTNIAPEIVVEARTISDAEEILLPHIESLFDKYLNFTEKPREVKKEASEPKKEVSNTTSEAFEKAKSAIDNCMTVEALDLIEKKINESEKLTNRDKLDLSVPGVSKRQELLAKE